MSVHAMPVKRRLSKSRVLMGASAVAIGWAVSTAALALPVNPTIFANSPYVGTAATFTPGTGTLTVTQNADRVVIDWDSFDIAAGETVTFVQGADNFIAFNRIDPSSFTTIDGNLFGNGSVWLFSPGGILFGANAQVNVGSFFAGIGELDNFQANQVVGLSDTSVFVNYGLVSNPNTLSVASGASITGTDFVILQGAVIDMAGDLVSSGGVGFINAEGAVVDFDTTSPSGVFPTQMHAAPEPGGRGTPSFDHTGTTTAAWVDLQFAQLFEADFEQIINLDGVITATGTGSTLEFRPANTAIFVGGLDTETGLTDGRTVLVHVVGEIHATAGAIDLQGTDVVIASGALVDSATSISVFTYGDITVSGDVVSGQGTLMHGHAATSVLTVDGTIDAGGVVDLSTVAPDTQVNIDGTITSLGQVNIRSGGDILISGYAVLTADTDGNGAANDLGINVVAGTAFNVFTDTSYLSQGDVYVESGASFTAGTAASADMIFITAHYGDIDFGGEATGSKITLRAGDDIIVSGDLTAYEDINILGWTFQTPTVGGDITITGDATLIADARVLVITHYGDLTIEGGAYLRSDADDIDTASINVGPNLDVLVVSSLDSLLVESGATLNSGALATVLYADGPDTGSTLADAAMVIEGDVQAGSIYMEAYNGSIVISGTLSADESIDIYAANAFVLTGDGVLNADSAFSGTFPYLTDLDYAGVLIRASDVGIAGEINAEAIAFRALGDSGQDMVIGGDDGVANVDGFELDGQFNLSNDEFQHLNGAAILFVGGVDNTDPDPIAAVDVEIQDLTIDASVVSTVVFGTSSQNDIDVLGALTPSQPNTVSLFIGGIIDNPEFVGLSGFIPGQINVLGSIGTAANPFAHVNLLATEAIFMGSSDFILAAMQDEDFNANLPDDDLAVEEGHIFIAADVLTMATPGRIIQQNTGAEGQFAGLLIGEPEQGMELISADPSLEGAVIAGPNGYTISFEAGPKAVQLFGVLIGQSGHISGPEAAESPWLLSAEFPSNVQYTINGCSFGGSPCGNASEVPQFETPTDIAVDDIEPVDEAAADETADDEEAAEDQAASEDQDSELFRSLVAPGADRAYEQERIGEPITGSGNEDLWTGRGDGARP